MPHQPDGRTTVVVATRDRRDELLRTVRMLATLPEQPPIIVVDNASSDGSAAAVRALVPSVRVIALDENRGAVARNVGVQAATTPYVAFADDDSWWDPGSLAAAAASLDACREVAVVTAEVRLGSEGRPDPLSLTMAASPLPSPCGLRGRGVVGFPTCAAVVRRSAFLAVGGFDPLLHFYGEEELLAYDLLAAGWYLVHDDALLVRHHPSPARDLRARLARQHRNRVLVALLRRPWPVVATRFAAMARGLDHRTRRRATVEVALRAPVALARRRRPSPRAEALLAAVEPQEAGGDGAPP